MSICGAAASIHVLRKDGCPLCRKLGSAVDRQLLADPRRFGTTGGNRPVPVGPAAAGGETARAGDARDGVPRRCYVCAV